MIREKKEGNDKREKGEEKKGVLSSPSTSTSFPQTEKYSLVKLKHAFRICPLLLRFSSRGVRVVVDGDRLTLCTLFKNKSLLLLSAYTPKLNKKYIRNKMET